MKQLQFLAIAALMAAAAFQTTAKADDPINPAPGAVCNLYLIHKNNAKETAATLASQPAAATFVDSASEFKCSSKKEGIDSDWGMWTGWLRQSTGGTYTFTCRGGYISCYSIWINGVNCASCVSQQYSFNADLSAGFNSVQIIAYDGGAPLTITYKKAGSVKDPISFGPENMYYDDEE